jgi:hypothetical protein
MLGKCTSIHCFSLRMVRGVGTSINFAQRPPPSTDDHRGLRWSRRRTACRIRIGKAIRLKGWATAVELTRCTSATARLFGSEARGASSMALREVGFHAVYATTIGWPDLARLGFGTGAQSGSIPIGLEDDGLDRLGALLGERGRSAVQQIALPEGTAPPNDPERLIAGTLQLPNAIWRLKAVELGRCNCLLLSFRYTAISDEKRDGIVWLGFNCTTGAVLHDELVAALRRALDRADGWQAPTPDAIGAAGTAWPADMIAARPLPLSNVWSTPTLSRS